MDGARAIKVNESKSSLPTFTRMAGKAEVREIIRSLKERKEERGDLWMYLIKNRDIGKQVFLSILTSRNNQEMKVIKMEALLAMQLMGDEGIHIMKEAFPKADKWTQSQLVGIFALSGKDFVIDELITAVDDRNITSEKRLLALNKLVNLDERHTGRLLKLLESKDPTVRSRIARVFGQKKYAPAKDRLKEMLLTEKDMGVLYSVIEALRDLGEDITIDEVMALREGETDLKGLRAKIDRIARRFGKRVAALISLIVSILLSLGYSLSYIFSLLNMFVRSTVRRERDAKDK